MDFEVQFPGEKMICYLDLVHYACIAKGTKILAEFNSSNDAALSALAMKCLDETPPFHSMFAHTVRSRTYSFLIDESFVCFAIFDENMGKSERLAFLKGVRGSISGIMKGKHLERLGSHCFQAEFIPVFRRLLGSSVETFESPEGQRFDQIEDLQCRSEPIVGSSSIDGERSSRTMKNRLLGEISSGRKKSEKKEADEDDGKGGLLNHKKGGLYPGEMLGHQKAKKVWKKQVWIILSLDLFICLILFVVWLWVCSGFKCMNS